MIYQDALAQASVILHGLDGSSYSSIARRPSCQALRVGQPASVTHGLPPKQVLLRKLPSLPAL